MRARPDTRFHTRRARFGTWLLALVVYALLTTRLFARRVTILILWVTLRAAFVFAVEKTFAWMILMMSTENLAGGSRFDS